MANVSYKSPAGGWPEEWRRARSTAVHADATGETAAMPDTDMLDSSALPYVFGGVGLETMAQMIEDGFDSDGWSYLLIDAVLSNDMARISAFFDYAEAQDKWEMRDVMRTPVETLRCLDYAYNDALQQVSAQTWRHLSEMCDNASAESDFSDDYELVNILPYVSVDAGAALVDLHGGGAAPLLQQLQQEAQDDDDRAIADACRRVLDAGYVSKSSSCTLTHTQFPQIDGEYHTLRSMFNFRSRRVNDIYTAPEQQPCMTSSPMDEYDAGLVDQMEKKLLELGGVLPDRNRLDKKRGLME